MMRNRWKGFRDKEPFKYLVQKLTGKQSTIPKKDVITTSFKKNCDIDFILICSDPDAPPPPPEPKPNTSKTKTVKEKQVESHSIEDLGDISSEFSVEVEDLSDLTLDPTKKKGKFYKLVKSMKNRRKSVQVAKSADNLDLEDKNLDTKPERKKSFKFHRRFSLSRGRED